MNYYWKKLLIYLLYKKKGARECAMNALKGNSIRCYHKDGSYHFVHWSKSSCGSLDVDLLGCAERDGHTPMSWSKAWKRRGKI